MHFYYWWFSIPDYWCLLSHFYLLEEVEDEVDEDGDIMECDKAQSEEESDDEPSDEAETMTVTSEAPIPADKYDQATNLTEEQETLQKIRGNYWNKFLLYNIKY